MAYLDEAGLTRLWEKIKTLLYNKQDKLSAGTNVTISGTTISANDTTYSAATTSNDGLMSSTDKTKLDGIATHANNYSHPTGEGNLHLPAGSPSVQGYFLRYGSDGPGWDDLTTATTTSDGLMSKYDKASIADVSEAIPLIWDAINKINVINGVTFDKIYPIGSIYMSVNDTNPSTLFPNTTWEAWGAGKVPVGVNASESEFNTVEKTGGTKDAVIPYHNHTFTGTAVTSGAGGAHSHSIGNALGTTLSSGWSGDSASALSGSGQKYGYTKDSGTINTVKTTGSESSHTHSVTAQGTISYAGTSGNTSGANLQPYITCYMWKRTA